MSDARRAVRDAAADVFDAVILQTISKRGTLRTPELYRDNKLPVDVIQFVEDPYYLGGQVDLQPGVKDVLWAVEDADTREADLEVGKGSGKSSISAITTLYGAYLLTWMRHPQQFFGLAQSDILASVNVSTSRSQAKDVVFQSIKGKVEESPYFRSLSPQVLTVEIQLPNNVRLYCGHSGDRAFLGFAMFRGVMDEVNYMTDSSNRTVAKQLYDALHGSMKTRFPNHYKLISVSSITQATTWLHKRVVQAERDGELFVPRGRTFFVVPREAQPSPKAQTLIEAGELSRTEWEEYAALRLQAHKYKDRLAIQAPTWSLRHPVKKMDDFLDDLVDPEKRDSARRDFANLPGGNNRPFFRLSTVLDMSATSDLPCPVQGDAQALPAGAPICLEDWFVPVPGAVYAFAADLSVSGDATGLALVHFEQGTGAYVLDFSARVVAERGGRVDYEPIRELVRSLRVRGFRIGGVGFDQFQSNDSFLLLERDGFKCHIVKHGESLMGCNTLHEFITNRRLQYGAFNSTFIGEAKELQVINDKRIDHQKSGGRFNSKDVWDAVVNAVFLTTELVKEAHGDVLQTKDVQTFSAKDITEPYPLTEAERALPADQLRARQLPNNRHALIANLSCRYSAERDSDIVGLVVAAVPMVGRGVCRVLHAETLRATPEGLAERLVLLEKEWAGRGFWRTRRGQSLEVFAPDLHFFSKLEDAVFATSTGDRAVGVDPPPQPPPPPSTAAGGQRRVIRQSLAVTPLDVTLSEDVRIRGAQAVARDGRLQFPDDMSDKPALRSLLGQLVAYPFVPNTHALVALEGVYRASETVDFTVPRLTSRVLGLGATGGV